MTGRLNKLTAVVVKNAKPGRHGDGGGLYLSVGKGGSRSWVYRWMKYGRVSEMGLGSWPAVSLADARDLAHGFRKDVAAGRNPKAMRDRARNKARTFGETCDDYLRDHDARWTNDKTRWQWKQTLDVFCAPIRNVPVSEVDTDRVVKLLKPVWADRREKAKKARMRIEAVLDYARAKEWRDGENPARWKGHLDNILPTGDVVVKHHTAMHYDDVPALMKTLRTVDAMSAKSLRFLILTAARTGEVINAVWSEIDWDNKLWVIPAARMKMKREHRVPLNAEAFAIIKELYEVRRSDLIFNGQSVGKPQSNMAMAVLLRRLNIDVTVHGFRSSFRDWAGDKTNFDRDMIELSLAHKVVNDVELSYRRSDAIEKRSVIMGKWHFFLNNG